MMTTEIISQKYTQIKWSLNEKQRRIWAWVEVLAIWIWGIAIVSKGTWMARNTVKKWKIEVEEGETLVSRIRKPWWGRKKKVDQQPEIKEKIIELVESSTIWNPEWPLTWTLKSLRNIERWLKKDGYNVWYNVISKVLKEKWYSLQNNKKMIEWGTHEDRNEQFEFISKKIEDFQDEGYAVLSIDTKKKELVGNFKNEGKEWNKKGEWEKVNVYDFINNAKWKASPYWVYDITNNKWRVNVGISADTSQFAVESIRRRKDKMWKKHNVKKVYITADWWGSNGSRVRLWKIELQKLANERGSEIHVSHLPPWTSKRNKIEHRLFCHISQNWRWKPLRDFMTIVNLIWNTKTTKWLEVQCMLDTNVYEKGIKISDEKMKKINIEKNNFHWEWNYIIRPQNS